MNNFFPKLSCLMVEKIMDEKIILAGPRNNKWYL